MSMAISARYAPYQTVSRTKMSFSSQPQEREFSLEEARSFADKEKEYGKEIALDLLMKRFRTECNKKNNPEGIFKTAKDALSFIVVEVPNNSSQHDVYLGKQIVERLGKTGSNLKREMLLKTAKPFVLSTTGQSQENKRKTWDRMTAGITYESCSNPES
jgi:hypothetical protein